jgi:antitoxin component YwqK of YwqJK toxin-antitoxin module
LQKHRFRDKIGFLNGVEVQMTRKFIALLPLVLSGCFWGGSENDVLSTKYIHKYGFDVSETEWQARDRDGQVVTMLKSGEKITQSYENGVLNGVSSYTFPHSSVVQKLLIYNQGALQKEVVNDFDGIPITEDLYESDERRISTSWDEKGSPLSVEEYDAELLVEGKYFTPNHELEGSVEAGFGERYRRDRSGQLISRDLVENGKAVSRTNYHANGQIHSISRYHEGELHGEQRKFTSSGAPLMDLNWNHGTLDGMKIVYRNGHKVSEIPYISGQKHGTELHFGESGLITAQIEWKNDRKHGCSRFINDDSIESEWFYKGSVVSQEKFETMDNRENMIADLSLDDGD